jgi:hypothetical protein
MAQKVQVLLLTSCTLSLHLNLLALDLKLLSLELVLTSLYLCKCCSCILSLSL